MNKEISTLPEIGSLWIGAKLTFLEQLCLKSFVDHGHRVTLYSYAPVGGVPAGIEQRDAREIYDDDDFLIHKERQSPALHADIFRVKMLRMTRKVWMDCDVLCLGPTRKTNDYLFAFDSPQAVCNAVLAMPSDSAALAELDKFLSTKGTRPPWWDDAVLQTHMDEFGHLGFENMKWALTGPTALTWFLENTGEIEKAIARKAIYPLASNRVRMVLRRPRIVQELMTEDTFCMHMYATRMKNMLREMKIPANSFFAMICERHAIEIPAALCRT